MLLSNMYSQIEPTFSFTHTGPIQGGWVRIDVHTAMCNIVVNIWNTCVYVSSALKVRLTHHNWLNHTKEDLLQNFVLIVVHKPIH